MQETVTSGFLYYKLICKYSSPAPTWDTPLTPVALPWGQSSIEFIQLILRRDTFKVYNSASLSFSSSIACLRLPLKTTANGMAQRSVCHGFSNLLVGFGCLKTSTLLLLVWLGSYYEMTDENDQEGEEDADDNNLQDKKLSFMYLFFFPRKSTKQMKGPSSSPP